MALNPLAGKLAPATLLIDVAKLERDYYERKPDLADTNQLVSFGTSGHRGTPGNGTFNEAHILATTQAICEYRRGKNISGPLFLGKDSHAASAPAQRTALEVLAANGVETFIQRDDGFTPTPSISHAILSYNRGRANGLGDGIVITPSHNPPSDGGFKYNPTNGGPADTDITGWVQNRANELLCGDNRDVKRVSYESALKASNTHLHDFITPYVAGGAGDIIARLDALNGIVHDLLVFARPRQLRSEATDLDRLIRNSLHLLHRDPSFANLHVEFPQTEAVAPVDAEQLQLVFTNVLMNAAQAMGGSGEIQVGIERRLQRFVISIADHGPGMPPDVREKAFEPFFTTKHRGTGLGLPTARRIVEAHGGTVVAESDGATGTTLRVMLPLAR